MQGRLPFMEPKKFHKENEVNRHCYKRAKAFIGTEIVVNSVLIVLLVYDLLVFLRVTKNVSRQPES